jgi:hypothetical protein
MREPQKAKKEEPVALFVEGAHHLDTRNQDWLVSLWRFLSSKAGFKRPIRIVGFNKPQLIALNPPPKWNPRYEPIDRLIAREHKKEPFADIIIAFDTRPPNEALDSLCMGAEVEFILEGLSASKELNADFRADAHKLLEHYRKDPRCASRPKGRPPHLSVELLAMDPMFEDLFLEDEVGVKKVLGVGKDRRWPSFKRPNRKPDNEVMMPAVDCAQNEARRQVGANFIAHKHSWALYLLKRLSDSSPIWNHQILKRLELLAA